MHLLAQNSLSEYTFAHVTGLGLTRGDLRQSKTERHQWRGNVFVKGNWCFEVGEKAKRLVFFYSELFTFKANIESDITIVLQVRGTLVNLKVRFDLLYIYYYTD